MKSKVGTKSSESQGLGRDILKKIFPNRSRESGRVCINSFQFSLTTSFPLSTSRVTFNYYYFFFFCINNTRNNIISVFCDVIGKDFEDVKVKKKVLEKQGKEILV